MLLKNASDDLVNGSRGVVKSFDPDGTPIVMFVNNIEMRCSEAAWNLEDSRTGEVLATRVQVSNLSCPH